MMNNMDESSVEYRNFMATEAYSKETRKFQRKLMADMDGLNARVMTQERMLQVQQNQIGVLLAQVNGGAPTA